MYLVRTDTGRVLEGTDAAKLLNNCPETLHGTVAFLQSERPTRPHPYWKIVAGKVVDMSDADVAYLEAVRAWEAMRAAEFRGHRYRVEIEQRALFNSTAYPALSLHALADRNIETDTRRDVVEGEPVTFFVVYLDTIYPEHDAIFADPDFKIFDANELKPL